MGFVVCFVSDLSGSCIVCPNVHLPRWAGDKEQRIKRLNQRSPVKVVRDWTESKQHRMT